MAKITLKQITKTFESETVIKNLNLEIEDGSFTVLVGPSGCGKSTTLRMIAGLEKLTSGELWIGDRCVNQVPPGKRDVAMVFQNYALYPTMNVKENIAFGLKNRGISKKERERLIEEISETVGLNEYLYRKPSALSGGQRQRVALARAMVKKPKVFLMDEPLSNLDAKLRNHMRSELIELHKKLGTTFVYVTHDQTEAMSMGDKIVLMNKGEIQQVDEPLRIYHSPNNLFTARFIGSPPMNIMETKKVPFGNVNKEKIVYAGIRPEKIMISNEGSNEGLVFSGNIITRETLGAETLYKVVTEIGELIVKSYLEPIVDHQQISLFIPFRDLHFFDTSGKRVVVENSLIKPLEVSAGGA